jgi:alpha-1,6-mannosyltransferase
VEIRSRRAPGLVVQTFDRFGSGRFRPAVRITEEAPSTLVPNARRAVAASVLGMFFVAIVSATPNSPFYPVLPLGMEAATPLRWLSGVLGLGHLDITALMLVGLLATVSAAIGFVLLIRECWAGRIPVRTVVILVLTFHAIVLMLPLLFSRDVYSYAFYGRIVSTYRANPYGATPSDFPLNSLFPLTWPGWRTTTSVYGPLFTWISALMTSVVKRPSAVVTSFQLLAAAASLGTIAVVGRLVQRVRPDRTAFAIAMIGCNPIVIYHVVGGGHNDMLVAFFVACAVSLLFSRREMLSAVALALGVSVKASAAVPLALLIVAVVANEPPERRSRLLLTYGGVVTGVWLALALPFMRGGNPISALLEVSSHDSWMAPGQLIVRGASGLGGLIGGDALREPFAMVARIALFGASFAAVAAIARRIWTSGWARTPTALAAAWGWAFLAITLPSPVLFTWYLVWALPLAWVMPKIARRGMVILSAFFVVTQLVTETSRLPAFLRTVKLPFGHPVAIAVCVWVGYDLVRRLRRGTALDAETDEPAFGDGFESGPKRHEDEDVTIIVLDEEPILATTALEPIPVEPIPSRIEAARAGFRGRPTALSS